MSVVVLVLLGFCLVTAVMSGLDQLKADHPELFGLAGRHEGGQEPILSPSAAPMHSHD